jgi:hypothetical protein
MRKILIYTALILGVFISENYAKEINYEYADSLSYALFTHKEYAKLEIFGNKAIDEKVDFYYLRMRMGAANYELQHYSTARVHFSKALGFFPIDTIAKEYIYYSYYLEGKIQKARLFAKQYLPKSIQDRILAQTAYKHWAVSWGGGYVFNSNISDNRKRVITDNSNYINGEQNLQGNASFSELKLENFVNQKLNWKAGISYFNINYTGRFHHPYTNLEHPLIDEYRDFTNKQWQFNGLLNYNTSKQWRLTGAIGFYNQIYSFMTSTVDIYPFYKSSQTNKNEWSYMASFGINKTFNKNILFVNTTYANWKIEGTMFQLQPCYTREWLKSSKLYSTSMLTYMIQNNTNQVVFTQKIGGQIAKPLWFEAQFSYGNHKNLIFDQGFITLNTAEPIKLILGGDLTYKYKNLFLNIGYKYQIRTATYYNYSLTEIKNYNYNYSNHLLNTSITWKF